MKQLSFVQMVVMLVLVVTFASCGFSQPLYEDNDYGDRRVMRRDVYTDPYYGNTTRIVRDPYTGQLYEVTPVSPYGGYYPGASSYPYGTYGGRNYGRTNRGSYGSSAPQRTLPQPQQPRQQSSEKIERARDIINGKQ